MAPLTSFKRWSEGHSLSQWPTGDSKSHLHNNRTSVLYSWVAMGQALGIMGTSRASVPAVRSSAAHEVRETRRREGSVSQFIIPADAECNFRSQPECQRNMTLCSFVWCLNNIGKHAKLGQKWPQRTAWRVNKNAPHIYSVSVLLSLCLLNPGISPHSPRLVSGTERVDFLQSLGLSEWSQWV